VWVCRRDSAEPYVQKADNVAALEDFYTVEVSPFVGDERGARPFAIDEMWSHIVPEPGGLTRGSVVASRWRRPLHPSP
jgi:hypothetical protein